MELNLRKHKTKRPTKNAKGRKMAVKGAGLLFAALLTVCLVCAPILAAPGGTYRIEEAGMTLEIPSDWWVISRDVSPSDPDLARFGNYDMMKEMEAGKIYLMAMHNSQGYVTVHILSDIEEFAEIDNLTETYLKGSESDKQALVNATENRLLAAEDEYVGVYYSDEANKVNNYVYLRVAFNLSGMMTDQIFTVIDGKVVMFDAIPIYGSTLTEAEKNTYYQILSTVHYDNKPTVEEVMTAVEESKSSGMVIWLVVLGALAVAVVVVVLLLRRKKQTSEPDDEGNAAPQTKQDGAQGAPSVEPLSASDAEPVLPSSAAGAEGGQESEDQEV